MILIEGSTAPCLKFFLTLGFLIFRIYVTCDFSFVKVTDNLQGNPGLVQWSRIRMPTTYRGLVLPRAPSSTMHEFI